MLVLRLQRTGKNKEATYKVVVAEKSDPVKKKSIETVGNFIPQRDPVHLVLKQDRIKYWMGKGAKPSDTLARILKKEGMDGMDQYILRYTKQKKRKASEDEETPAEAPAEKPAKDVGAQRAVPDEEKSEEGTDEPPSEKAKDAADDKPAEETPPPEEKPEDKPAEVEPKAEEKTEPETEVANEEEKKEEDKPE